jgi:hypothetical protein
MSETTEVKEKDLPVSEATYINAPEDLIQARERILAVEMALEDLARAVEIAQITGSWEILDTFRTTANEVLSTKIEIVQPDLGEIKIQTIHNDMEEEFDVQGGRIIMKKHD